MPSLDPKTRSGHLEPTIEFERAWAEFGPTVAEVFAAFKAVANALVDMPPAAADASTAERGRQVHDWLTAHTDVARLRAVTEAVAAVGLELRDPTGRPVATESVMIHEVLPPPAGIPAAVIERAVAEAREEGLEVRFPWYIAVVRGAADDGLPSRPHA